MQNSFMVIGFVDSNGQTYSNTYLLSQEEHDEIVEKIHSRSNDNNIGLCDRHRNLNASKLSLITKDAMEFQYVDNANQIPAKFRVLLAKRIVDLIYTLSRALSD